MGRNPLKTQICRYLEANAGYLAEATLVERGRKLEAFQRRYGELCKSDTALQRDPAKWTDVEVKAILLEMRKHDWSPTTQAHEIENIAAMLRYVGNPVFDTTKARAPTLFPRRVSHRGPSLSAIDRQKILEAAEHIKGWSGEIARFLISAHMYTGLRPKELRVSEATDLDANHWMLHVRHPKGEGTYGDPRDVVIPNPLRPYVERYLGAREKMLADKGMLFAKPLLCRKDAPNVFYSPNRLQKIKAKVEQLSGVKFELRALRRTYGQMLLDNDADLETASLALGHRSVRTTQAYYCQRSMDTVKTEVLRALECEMSIPLGTENRLISRTDKSTGYA
jgi:integrase/recombinase XerD